MPAHRLVFKHESRKRRRQAEKGRHAKPLARRERVDDARAELRDAARAHRDDEVALPGPIDDGTDRLVEILDVGHVGNRAARADGIGDEPAAHSFDRILARRIDAENRKGIDARERRTEFVGEGCGA